MLPVYGLQGIAWCWSRTDTLAIKKHRAALDCKTAETGNGTSQATGCRLRLVMRCRREVYNPRNEP